MEWLKNSYYLRILIYVQQKEWLRVALIKSSAQAAKLDASEMIRKAKKLAQSNKIDKEIVRVSLLLSTYFTKAPIDKDAEYIKYGVLGAQQIQEEDSKEGSE